MPENTFDIVSKIDLEEVSNAIQQASKEVHTRFDLKDSKSKIELEKDVIVLHRPWAAPPSRRSPCSRASRWRRPKKLCS